MYRIPSALCLLVMIYLPAAAQQETVRTPEVIQVAKVEKSDTLPVRSFASLNREQLSKPRVSKTGPTAKTLDDATAPQQAPEDNAELAKKLSNPVASLISLPFQNNLDCGLGQTGTCRNTLNIQPVIPLSISKSYNLIIRTIVPIIGQGAFTDGGDSKFGLGDTVQSFFFSPKQLIGGLVLAYGPVGLYPTATSRSFGPGKWGAGPTALVLKQSGGWSVGMLANHIWSFAGPKSRGDVNLTYGQPFLNHTWKNAWTLGGATESTYDWENKGWAVPLVLNASKVTKLGGQLVSIGFGPKVWVARPSAGTPKWGIRFTFTLLYPKKG